VPYLPSAYTQETRLPQAFDVDIRTKIQLIEEQARQFFTEVAYYSIRNLVGIASVDTVTAAPAPVGESGGTGFDPVYGEIVDPDMVDDGAWTQPHLNTDPDIDADTEATEVYDGPFMLRGRVQREGRDYDLKRYGFDEMRDLMVHFPVSILDACGLTLYPGDKFVWDGDEYLVLQDKATGYWKNTNIRLWRTVMAEHKRRGA